MQVPTELSPLEDLIVLFVPDPSRGEKLSGGAEGLLTWFELRLKEDRYKEILEDFGKYIVPSRSKEGYYWIHESVCVYNVDQPRWSSDESLCSF